MSSNNTAFYKIWWQKKTFFKSDSLVLKKNIFDYFLWFCLWICPIWGLLKAKSKKYIPGKIPRRYTYGGRYTYDSHCEGDTVLQKIYSVSF
jgi:hypothetical protein